MWRQSLGVKRSKKLWKLSLSAGISHPRDSSSAVLLDDLVNCAPMDIIDSRGEVEVEQLSSDTASRTSSL